MNLVLASASPRRSELLERLTKDFQIIASNFNEEEVIYFGNIEEYVCDLAEGKAREVVERIKEPSIIIGCDTIVFFEGKILGKPKDEKEAFAMLKALSGKTHEVYSGITLIHTVSNKVIRKALCTKVKFMDLSEEMILKYIRLEKPMDKAGAYGIQDGGAVFVEHICGCYYNVMGLSLNGLYLLLRDMGVNL